MLLKGAQFHLITPSQPQLSMVHPTEQQTRLYDIKYRKVTGSSVIECVRLRPAIANSPAKRSDYGMAPYQGEA